jgi:hypothetical protein|tara:strand:+ start:757 stop:1773 length:1017 start_codon:yes stop_codon:yes gene_type:complete
MGIFNIFKRKKQASREQLLEDSRKDQKLASDDDSLSYQYNLAESHKNEDNQPVIYESMMSDGNHKNIESVESSLEMRMSDSSNSGMYKHRNDGKDYSMSDIDIASEKRDREFRDAYVEAESKLDKKKSIFSSMAGAGIEDDAHMISDNVPMENSGLNIAPERFKNFGETPDGDAKSNLKNYGKNPDITPMKFASSRTSGDILSMIQDADALSFMIKTQSNRSGVALSFEEKDNLSKIKAAKSFLVESLRIKTAEYSEFGDQINGMDIKDVMKDLLEYEERGLSHGEMASFLDISEDEVSDILQRRDEYPDLEDDKKNYLDDNKIEEIDSMLRSISDRD